MATRPAQAEEPAAGSRDLGHSLAEAAQVLSQIPVFAPLTTLHRAELLRTARRVHYARGAVLMAAGDPQGLLIVIPS